MSKIIHYKQWHLSFFEHSDIEYVKGLGCNYEVHDKAKTIKIMVAGQPNYIKDPTSSYGLEVITENEQQESMIQLKYCGDIKLLRMWHTFITDTI